jgi:hypothetical protein
MVTVVPVRVAEAVQLVAPGSVIVGVAGITKPEANVIVIVSPWVSAPLPAFVALGVKPTVQVAVAPAVIDEPAKVTPVTLEVMVTVVGGLDSLVSLLVETVFPP